VNGKDSVITFNISETSAVEDEGLAVGFSTSCVFVFLEDFSASFHFLGANTFGSSTIFIFFKFLGLLGWIGWLAWPEYS
jgi:hypothetical protein